jgi:hypothetical protein
MIVGGKNYKKNTFHKASDKFQIIVREAINHAMSNTL